MIVGNADTKTMLEVFMRSIGEIDDEITALSTMCVILGELADALRRKSSVSLKSALLNDEALLSALNSLSLTKITFKEKRSMNDLNKASEVLTRLKSVRIVQLPPLTVASYHFYEVWATIPDDIDVPTPLTKKKFRGGLYAAHTIKIGDFHEWADLSQWVEGSDKYEKNYVPEDSEAMNGCLEEHLNWVYANHLGWPENFIDGQLDLLLPIKLKVDTGKS